MIDVIQVDNMINILLGIFLAAASIIPLTIIFRAREYRLKRVKKITEQDAFVSRYHQGEAPKDYQALVMDDDKSKFTKSK